MRTERGRPRATPGIIICLVLGVALTLGVGGQAQDEVGLGAGSTFAFGVDARALAMGGAYVALAEGYSAPYWNPAGLAAQTASAQVGAMNVDKFGLGIQFNYLGGAARVPQAGITAGGAVLGSFVADVPVPGSGDEPARTVNNNEIVVIGSTALPLPVSSVPVRIGGSAKYYVHTLAGERGSGIGGDLGIQADLGSRLRVGASVSDAAGTLITWSTGDVDRVGMTVRLGGAIDLAVPVPTTVSGQYDLLGRRAHLGVEVRPSPAVALRAGGQRLPDGGLSATAGIGVSFGRFRVDGAFVQNPSLGNSLVVSGEAVF